MRFSNFAVQHKNLKSMLTDGWAPPPGLPTQVGLGWGQILGFVLTYLVRPVVLGQVAHFEDNFPRQMLHKCYLTESWLESGCHYHFMSPH